MLSSYDLNAQDLDFWFSLGIDGRKVQIVAKMRPYEENDAINLEREKGVLLKESKEEEGHDIEVKSIEFDKEFFDRHKVSVSNNGLALSPETMKLLDARISPPFSSLVINRGYRPTIDDTKDFSDPDGASLDALLSKDIEVSTFFSLYDPSEQKEIELNLVHIFRTPHAGDAMRWEQRQRTRTLSRGRLRGIVDHYVIKESYNSMIKSVRGYTMGGSACDSDNKGQWLAKIPYWHKMTSVSQVFISNRKNG